MKEIQLNLTIDEVNQILDVLGSQPFKTVFQLIGKIQQQAQHQLSDNGDALSRANGKPQAEAVIPEKTKT